MFDMQARRHVFKSGPAEVRTNADVMSRVREGGGGGGGGKKAQVDIPQ